MVESGTSRRRVVSINPVDRLSPRKRAVGFSVLGVFCAYVFVVSCLDHDLRAATFYGVMTVVIPIVVWHCLQEATLDTLEAERSRSGRSTASLSSSDQRYIARLTAVSRAVFLLVVGVAAWGYFIQHSVTVAITAFAVGVICGYISIIGRRHILIQRLRSGR